MEIIRAIRDIYDMLQDEESKEIYIKRMEYLLSGNYAPIEEITRKYNPELPAGPYLSPEEIVKRAAGRSIVIYGAGGDSTFYSAFFRKLSKIAAIIFCDKNENLQNNGFLGYKVISPQELQKDYKDAYIVIASTQFREDIKHNLLLWGFSNNQICEKLFPLMTTSENQYFEPEIISFAEEEVYVDGGSLNLSSVKELAYLSKVKKAYAFEPNPVHFETCLKIKESLDIDVEMVPYGLWSSKDELRFEPRDNGSSHLNKNGKSVIKVCALEDVIDPDEKVTFIKMDIEGAELEALKGCRHIIEKCRPKLAICIYHKPEDMYEIPLYIKSLVPEYRFYVRAYSNREIETVLYAVL
jgi:FkbM family methyltransferase